MKFIEKIKYVERYDIQLYNLVVRKFSSLMKKQGDDFIESIKNVQLARKPMFVYTAMKNFFSRL